MLSDVSSVTTPAVLPPVNLRSSSSSQFTYTRSYIDRRPEGIFVRIPAFIPADFRVFIDEVFNSGAYFSELNYTFFHSLLYDDDWLTLIRTTTAEVRIASGFAAFLPQRQALYRGVRILEEGASAEYLFEPVYLETDNQDMMSGISVAVDSAIKTDSYVPEKLDFDEFIAAMWLKQVRFGLLEQVIRQAIEKEVSSRITIASCLRKTDSQDASVVEVSTNLHRDNAPAMMENGKTDLGTFKNRFSQVQAGTKLLKKIPRKLGKPGYRITGIVIEPDMPKDIDLHKMAAAGTKVEQAIDTEYIVAAIDGFLNLNKQSGQISVTEKLENRTGINIKSTGNLALDVDEFIEHGEVQEGRILKGKSMTFLSDVFGKIMSQGGHIAIKKNLSGGHAESIGGNIKINGRVLSSTVLAREGTVDIGYCENSLIIGRHVQIENAVNCKIISNQMTLGMVEGCTIAGESIKLGFSNERKGKENLITVIIPGYPEMVEQINRITNTITNILPKIELKQQEIAAINCSKEFMIYLSLNKKISEGVIHLAAEQKDNWKRMMEKHASNVSKISALNMEMENLALAREKLENELTAITNRYQEMRRRVSCNIKAITGYTILQTMESVNGMSLFDKISEEEIRVILHRADNNKQRVFCSQSGTLEWQLVN